MRLNSIYLMLIKKECISTKKNSLTPITHQWGNSPTTHTLSYSIEYSSSIIFVCWGWVSCHTQRILHILGKESNSESRWSLRNKNWHENDPWFDAASNFCEKDINTALQLIFLVMALLQRKLSTILSQT